MLKTLAGLKQINLKSWHHLNLRGVGTLMYMWKTWVLLDPVANQIVGIGKRKRQFTKLLPEQPINACAMENGDLGAVAWLSRRDSLLSFEGLDRFRHFFLSCLLFYLNERGEKRTKTENKHGKSMRSTNDKNE